MPRALVINPNLINRRKKQMEIDWTLRMQEINKKVEKLNRLMTKDSFMVGACVISDYECANALMSIPERDWEKILVELYKTDKTKLTQKVEMILCYIAELKRLAGINLKELIGLTRDDVTALQRTCVLRKEATGRDTRNKVIETLSKLVDTAAECESNDKYLKEVCVSK